MAATVGNRGGDSVARGRIAGRAGPSRMPDWMCWMLGGGGKRL